MSSAKDKADLACRIFGILLNIPTLVVVIIVTRREEGNGAGIAAVGLNPHPPR